MNNNIILTGFPGSGKTFIGRHLSKKLNFNFFDVGSIIEKKFNKNIIELILSKGEYFFRLEELSIFKKICRINNSVISSGGGSFIFLNDFFNFNNRKIFCLNTSFYSIINNIKKSNFRIFNYKTKYFIENIYLIFRNRFFFYNRVFNQFNNIDKHKYNIINKIYNNIKFNIFNNKKTIYYDNKISKIYPIFINKNIINKFDFFLKISCLKFSNIISVIDLNAINKYNNLKIIKNILKLNKNLFFFLINSSEKLKKILKIKIIIFFLLSFNISRDSILIGIGGGTIGDFSSFIASVYKRGINFISLPTTLTGFYDSCIGGKNGVNFLKKKNIIGTFFNPICVEIDKNFSIKIFNHSYYSGFSEVVKHSLLINCDLFKILEDSKKININKFIYKSIKIKYNISSLDFLDLNNRFLLNLGHTFAHSIEDCSNFLINHGDAVSLGLVVSCMLSFVLKKSDIFFFFKILRVLKKFKLLYKIKKKKYKYIEKKKFISKLYFSILRDKKNNYKNRYFILPTGVGKIFICKKIKKKYILKSLNCIF